MHAFAAVAILLVFLNAHRELITSRRGCSIKEAEADRYAAPALSVAKIHQSRALEVPALHLHPHSAACGVYRQRFRRQPARLSIDS